jgi:hypothetical protein
MSREKDSMIFAQADPEEIQEHAEDRGLEDSRAVYTGTRRATGYGRRIHGVVDVPPEFPNPLEVLPKSPPLAGVVELPKPGVVVEPKPIPREDAGK